MSTPRRHVPWRGPIPALTVVVGTVGCGGWPFAHDDPPAPPEPVAFVEVGTVDALAARLATHQPTVVDVYADWCGPCKVLRRDVFPSLASELQGVQLITIDITEDTVEDRALWEHLGVKALPTVVFYGADGHELDGMRFTGSADATAFAHHLRRVRAAW